MPTAVAKETRESSGSGVRKRQDAVAAGARVPRSSSSSIPKWKLIAINLSLLALDHLLFCRHHYINLHWFHTWMCAFSGCLSLSLSLSLSWIHFDSFRQKRTSEEAWMIVIVINSGCVLTLIGIGLFSIDWQWECVWFLTERHWRPRTPNRYRWAKVYLPFKPPVQSATFVQ